MAAGAGESLTATVLHGSPFSYYECSTGDVRFRLAAPSLRYSSDPTRPARDQRSRHVTIAGQSYAIFAPTGATWEWTQPTELVLRLPAGARYFSVAGLPDARETTLSDFLAVAYAFPTDTRVEWSYDEAASKVRSVYRVQDGGQGRTEPDDIDGPLPPPLVECRVGPPFAARVRHGARPHPAGAGQQLHARAHLPWLRPHVGRPAGRGQQGQRGQPARRRHRQGAQLFRRLSLPHREWAAAPTDVGKGLGAAAQLHERGRGRGQDQDARRSPRATQGPLRIVVRRKRNPRTSSRTRRLGTFVGVPQEFNSINAMNDHHFHYGYWLMGAAHVALRDPEWASQQKWGGMVGKIISDIATDGARPGGLPVPAQLRRLRGALVGFGRRELRRRQQPGIVVRGGERLGGPGAVGRGDRRPQAARPRHVPFTSEIASVNQYWFDLERQVLAPEYGKPFASMVFGGKYAYNTWWTQEPRQIFGINLLPITPASTYLGAKPEYVQQPRRRAAGRGQGVQRARRERRHAGGHLAGHRRLVRRPR